MAYFLADVRCIQEVPTIVATGLLLVTEKLGWLYFLTRLAYHEPKLPFGASVRERQKLFAGWHNVELFTLWILYQQGCYSRAPICWEQYDVSAFYSCSRHRGLHTTVDCY